MNGMAVSDDEGVPTKPHVTVIITAYDPDFYEHVIEAVESILTGAYECRDVIVVVDGTDELYANLRHTWERDDVTVLLNEENVGAAASRNRAAEHARGSILAFMDDDAVADEYWLEELVRCYTEHSALAAGGKMEPIWLAGEPDFLPEEFYWIIGVTYRGFPDEMKEVRNTFASNLSIRKSIFEELGGFNTDIGPQGESLLQSAETDLCTRLAAQTNHGVLYNPDARVGHKIFPFRTDPLFLLRRAFWQGVSKRGMKLFSDAALESETEFLRLLVLTSIPERLWALVAGPRKRGFLQLLFLLAGTLSVGFGYLWGTVKFRSTRSQTE